MLLWYAQDVSERHTSGFQRAVRDHLACGCRREKLIMCNEGVRLFRALREAFPDAMWSGNWAEFDCIRDQLEAHLHADEPPVTTPVSA